MSRAMFRRSCRWQGGGPDPVGAPTAPTYNTTVFGQMKNAAADVLYQLMLTQNPIVDGSSPKHAKRLAGAFRGEQARK
jgi:hypothetical protein